MKMLFLAVLAATGAVLLPPFARAQWTTAARETAETGEGGILRKVWVKTGDAKVFRTQQGEEVIARLRKHAKAYHFGEAGDGFIAIGDKPKRKDCANFGYIHRDDVIVWDTDQALRFIGADQTAPVTLYADPGLTEPLLEATVEGEDDPTVEPFPIFRKTDDGKAFEIAFVYRGQGGDKDDPRKQQALERVVTKNINKVDVVFVMDITGSMKDELSAATEQVGDLINTFSEHRVALPDGREEPLLFRFAFLGFRDQEADGDRWLETIEFHSIGDIPGFKERMSQLVARGGGDQPESVYAAVREAVRMDWNEESGKAIVLIGDAPPRDAPFREEATAACTSNFIRVHSIVVGDDRSASETFRTLSLLTGGQSFAIEDAADTRTVEKIVESLRVEQAIIEQADETIAAWADGAKLSRDVQEFIARGILPDFGSKPIPPTVYVSSLPDGKEVCIYKSKPSLYEMLGDMQTDFVTMIEDPSPELLTVIAAGGVELIAELDPNILQSVLTMDDPSAASAEVQRMLAAMPELPGIVRELNEKGSLADWHTLARKTASLSRFISDPKNFYQDHAWVPFRVLNF